jgi:transcriptional regulator with XRE-family HTH domain
MRIGEKIKQLRVRTNLTQEELAIRCDLSKGFISQVERDLTSPSIATLKDMLECLGTNLNEFFQEPVSDQVLFRQEDAYTAEDDELGYKITWVIPNAQKNEMEPIVVTLRANGRTNAYAPHAGEVFGYVTTGAVTLHMGGHKWKVKKGECFYYAARESYYIENHTAQESAVVWVSAPPNF